MIFEDIIQLFKIELLFENFQQFFLELNVNNRKRDMLIEVTIFGLVLVRIILCTLLDGFGKNKFTIAIKDVIELRNMSPLSFKLLNPFIVGYGGRSVYNINPCISLIPFNFVHNAQFNSIWLIAIIQVSGILCLHAY